MFKIGEFSKLTQVTIRMLRYYDEMGLLKPAKVDEISGYRMYSIDQIPTLNTILYLRDSGFQVAEIKEALHKKSEAELIELLDLKYKEVEQNIQIEKERLAKLTLAKQSILDTKDLYDQVVIKTIPAIPVFSLRKVIPTYYDEAKLWKELSAYAKEYNVSLSDSSFSIYHDLDYRETQVDVELCVTVKELKTAQSPFAYRMCDAVDTMACMMVYGDFSNIAPAFLSFAKWLETHRDYQMCGNNRQIVHRGPWNESNPDQYLVELQLPVKQRH